VATYAHTTSNIGRVLVSLTVLWGLIGLSGRGSWADDDELSRASLGGLAGVYAIVTPLPRDIEQGGITTQQIQTDVELRLRQAGIPVLTQKEWQRVPGAPYLHVQMYATREPSWGSFAFRIKVEFKQLAYLVRDPSRMVSPATWDVACIGSVGLQRVELLRSDARDLVDQFINAYLSVNPRPAGSAAPASASPRRDLVRHAQERLQAEGFNPGTIDGSMGPQTQQALRWFQNAKGLVATGDLDEKTLNALEVR
jgi:hypothetical protein